MFDHTVAEHFPQDVTSELCQCGVDEQVLFLQSLRQRAARSGIFLLHSRVFHIAGDHLQRFHRFIQFGCRLSDFFRYGSEDDLSRILRVAKVHPVQWCLVVYVFRFRNGFQYVPEVETGLYVVRAGYRDISQIVPSGIFQNCRIDVWYRLPVVSEEVVHACDKTLRLVQSDVRWAEELPSDVGFSHDVGIIHGYEQSGVSESPECRIKPGQASQHLRACSSRPDKVYRYRMLRVYQIIVDVM